MQSSNIGRGIAFVIIAVFLIWTAGRSVGARPAATPNMPFPKPAIDEPLASAKGQESIVLAGGCFWGIQAVFEHLKGVTSAASGYSGGFVKSPSYETVSSGLSGHAESVSIKFDPSQITLGQILMVYFSVAHDPTQLNQQYPDTGSQYRSAVFYTSESQKHVIDAYIAQLNAAKVYSRPIVTKVEPFKAFFPAEDYHQDYLKNNLDSPYIRAYDLPKLEALKKDFPDIYRAN
jgi:peptide-methionine (S)-S-oxide reductase